MSKTKNPPLINNTIMDKKEYILRYFSPAPQVNDNIHTMDSTDNPDDGWEKWSLPVGNGFIGACIFGRTETERIQLTDNSFANKMGEHCKGGLNNLAEVYIEFSHNSVTEYERGLNISNALSYVLYNFNGVQYYRECFANYPSNVIAMKIECDKAQALSFRISAVSPFCGDCCVADNDGMGKQYSVVARSGIVQLKAHLDCYDVKGEVLITVTTDGTVNTNDDGSLSVSNAQSAVILISAGTNYKLDSHIFLEENPKEKLKNKDFPDKEIYERLVMASEKGYEQLKQEHLKDYKQYFDRVYLNLGGIDKGISTDKLISEYRSGRENRYLEELFFNYGRYLLISSSRQGGLPANLQGIWNRYSDSPWTAGYWHNINIQMNYWPAFRCQLTDMFKAYVNYFEAYLPSARKKADAYVKNYFPENYSGEGKNGWTIGTGAWPYEIFGLSIGDYEHSGPGTGAMTAMLFWDYYDFTGNIEILRKIYPALYEAALFLSKIMIFKDGKWLIKYSASPEQWQNQKCYRTTGCAFDQQTCYELFKDTIRASEILGYGQDELIGVLIDRIDKLDPFLIGASGQVKEYREETFYGEIGEKQHRHISQLIGIFPGFNIGKENNKLIEAVKTTLLLRGDRSTGWAMAHRLNVWAQTGDSEHTYNLLKSLLKNGVLTNLWDTHPPFQIDGNFGGCCGISEMLLQSNQEAIKILPSLPDVWSDGEFYGLAARGGFTVNVKWINKKPYYVSVISAAGNDFKLLKNKFDIKRIKCGNNDVLYSTSENTIKFSTETDKTYQIFFQ